LAWATHTAKRRKNLIALTRVFENGGYGGETPILAP